MVFIVKIEEPAQYDLTENFGSMLLSNGTRPITADGIKRHLECGFYSVPDLYFERVIGLITVTEAPSEIQTNPQSNN